MTFSADTPRSRCPVIGCLWVSHIPMWEPGGQKLVDDHMVERHPRTEWARRVVARREDEGLTQGRASE